MTTGELIRNGAPEALDVSDVTRTRAHEPLATLRDQLREAVPSLAPVMVDGFMESLEATKQLRIHEKCPKCDCNHVRYVRAPDFMERARAIDLLATNAEGRAGVAENVSQSPFLVRRVGRDRS